MKLNPVFNFRHSVVRHYVHRQ